MRLEVTIDELVLRGVAPGHAHAVATALEARLAALGEGSGALPPRDETFRRLPAVDVQAGDPAALGGAVAGAVWAAVAGGGAAR